MCRVGATFLILVKFSSFLPHSTKLAVDAKSFANIDDKFFAHKKEAAAKKDSFFAGEKDKKVATCCLFRAHRLLECEWLVLVRANNWTCH